MNRKYRYSDKRGVTRLSLRAVTRHLPKIGTPIAVRGYYEGRYLGTPNPWYRVAVRGTLGTLVLGGFSWGYGGEGPHGTLELLTRLGVNPAKAKAIAFHSPNNITKDKCGKTQWHLMVA